MHKVTANIIIGVDWRLNIKFENWIMFAQSVEVNLNLKLNLGIELMLKLYLNLKITITVFENWIEIVCTKCRSKFKFEIEFENWIKNKFELCLHKVYEQIQNCLHKV